MGLPRGMGGDKTPDICCRVPFLKHCSGLPFASQLIFCSPLTSFLLLFFLQDFTKVIPSGNIPNRDLGFLSRQAGAEDKQPLRVAFGGVCPKLGPTVTSGSLMLPETGEALS